MSDDGEGSRAETLHVEASRDDRGVRIVVVGESDMTVTESFWAHVSEALEAKPVPITVEARGWTFIDSSRLAALIRAHEAAGDTRALHSVSLNRRQRCGP